VREYKVEDVMTREVVAARPDTPFKDLVRLLYEHRVSGVPVIDASSDRLVGIVTETDLLGTEEAESAAGAETGGRGRSLLEWLVHPRRLAAVQRRAADLSAQDVMHRDVITAVPGMRVRDAVHAMLRAGVKRLPVVDGDGRVVGIVSRRDLLAPYLRPEQEIAREVIQDVIVGVMWLDPATIQVEVDRGVVTLNGQVDRKSTKDILAALVRRVDGVVGVEDRLTYREDDRKAPPGPPHHDLAWEENWVRR
jgi:CBS-domain-containing membrane protein